MFLTTISSPERGFEFARDKTNNRKWQEDFWRVEIQSVLN
jgi:hypothetical protein